MLVTVAAFREAWEAHMFSSRLEAEGVPAFVVHQHHVSIAWHYSNALGGVKVQVSEDRHAEAKQIEMLCRRDEFRPLLETEFGKLDDELHCPNCGADDFLKGRSLAATAMMATMGIVLGVAVPPTSWVYFCNRCSTRFAKPRLAETLGRWPTKMMAIGVAFVLLVGVMSAAGIVLRSGHWRIEAVIVILLVAAGLTAMRRPPGRDTQPEG